MNELTFPGRLGRVRATAYAKLTLSLRVLGKRPDGFHDIEALTVSIGDPHDVIEAEAVPHPGGITFDIDGEIDDVPADRTNLAYRAADELMLRAGRSGHGVLLRLRKKIPAGAGLGGGSADAAATLLALRRMLEIDIDDAGLVEIGAGLGSDVPFCTTGGAAWMRGRGEDLEPVEIENGLPFLVAIPPFGISTPSVYAAWDEMGGPKAKRSVPAPGEVSALVPELTNDLELAAEKVEPRLRPFRELLEETVRAPALLAGSGAACVVPFPLGTEDVAGIAHRVARTLKVRVAAATNVSRGVRVG